MYISNNIKKFLRKKTIIFGYKVMEKNMKDYILEDFKEYIDCVNQFDEETFTNDVLKSFKDSKTYKHYVMLIPSDIDEYYSNEEHNNFRKYGYHQLIIENRYGNRFFIPSGNMKIACDILKDENMVVELVKHANLPIKVYVVTLAGKANSKFDEDFDQAVDNNI